MVQLYWDRLHFKILHKALYDNDRGMVELCQAIAAIPRLVKERMIKSYVK